MRGKAEPDITSIRSGRIVPALSLSVLLISALSGPLFFCSFLSFGFLSSGAALAADSAEPTLKAIDPSAAQIDAPPPPEADSSTAGTNNNNPFNSNIQGQPLGKSIPSSSGGVAERPVEDATPQEESRVTNLEQKAFGATYSEHDVSDRLDHLEKEVLGGQKQGSLGERIARLETKLLGGSAFGAAPTTNTGPSASGAYGASGYGANTGGAASGAYGMSAPAYNNPGLGWVTGKSSAPPQAATNWVGAGQTPPGQSFAAINAPPVATVPSQPGQSAPPLSTSGWIDPDGGSTSGGGAGTTAPPQQQSQPANQPLSTSGWINPASQPTQSSQPRPQQQQSQQQQSQQQPQQQPLSTSGWVNPASQQPQQQAPSQSGWINPASQQPQQPQQQAPSQSGWINPASQQPQQPQQQAPSQSGWINPASQQPQQPQQQAPSQSGWINPAQQPQQQQQAPSQSGWINPGAPNSGTETLRPIQSMPGQNMPPQNMPPQNNQGSYGWNPAQQQMPPQQQQMPPQQQRPPQQQLPPQMLQHPPLNVRPGGGISADAQLVASSIVYDGSCGDYVNSIRKFPGSSGSASFSYAHWNSFPVKIRVAGGSPDSWQRSIDAVIARWGQYVPVKLALPNEVADVEVSWVNTLPKGLLGVTRLGVVKGRMHTWIYLLRPSFYSPEVPERALSHVFMREVGHALGLFGKSDRLGDLMFEAAGKSSSKAASIAQRDINTLKRVYEGPALPEALTLEAPLEWATSY